MPQGRLPAHITEPSLGAKKTSVRTTNLILPPKVLELTTSHIVIGICAEQASCAPQCCVRMYGHCPSKCFSAIY